MKSERLAGRHWADANGLASVRALDLFFTHQNFSNVGSWQQFAKFFAAPSEKRGAAHWREPLERVPQASYILTWSCSFVLLLTRMLVALPSRNARQTPVSTKCSPNECAGKNCVWRSAKVFLRSGRQRRHREKRRRPNQQAWKLPAVWTIARNR